MRISDWSSDVCSSDLAVVADFQGLDAGALAFAGFEFDEKAVGVLGQAAQVVERLVETDAEHAAVARQQRQFVGQRGLQRSEEHTSELQSLMRISYAVFCLKKKKTTHTQQHNTYNIRHK